jgi:hypothetical protein
MLRVGFDLILLPLTTPTLCLAVILALVRDMIAEVFLGM